MKYLTSLNEAHAYLLIGLIIILMKLSNIISVSWFWIIITLCTPIILGLIIFLMCIIFGLHAAFVEIEDDKDK